MDRNPGESGLSGFVCQMQGVFVDHVGLVRLLRTSSDGGDIIEILGNPHGVFQAIASFSSTEVDRLDEEEC
jgi:hypothetical protein